MPIPNSLGGGLMRPTAQQMQGGIPQNATPPKGLLGDGLLGMRGGPGVMGLRGEGQGPAPMQPPPVQAAETPPITMNPAQMQQTAPVPPVQRMGGPPMDGGLTPPIGGIPASGAPLGGLPPQLAGNPAILQALLARQAGGS